VNDNEKQNYNVCFPQRPPSEQFGPDTIPSSFATTATDHIGFGHKFNGRKWETVTIKPNDRTFYYRIHHNKSWLNEINQDHKYGDWFGTYRPSSLEDAIKIYNLPKQSKNSIYLYKFLFDVPFEHPEYCFQKSQELKTGIWQGLLTDRLITSIKVENITSLDGSIGLG